MTFQDPKAAHLQINGRPEAMSVSEIEWALWSAGPNFPEEWRAKNAVCKVRLRRQGPPNAARAWLLEVNDRQTTLSADLPTDAAKARAQQEYASHVLSAFQIAA